MPLEISLYVSWSTALRDAGGLDLVVGQLTDDLKSDSIMFA